MPERLKQLSSAASTQHSASEQSPSAIRWEAPRAVSHHTARRMRVGSAGVRSLAAHSAIHRSQDLRAVVVVTTRSLGLDRMLCTPLRGKSIGCTNPHMCSLTMRMRPPWQQAASGRRRARASHARASTVCARCAGARPLALWCAIYAVCCAHTRGSSTRARRRRSSLGGLWLWPRALPSAQ